ncbi:MAG: DMT family transporter [Phycisphaerae bacterium]|nr:DMT family transporter [Phycisphaerae bacterium]
MSIETNKIKGAALILGSGCMYSAMACMIKIASESTNSYVMAFIRFLLGLCVLGGLSLTGRINLKFTNWPLLIARGVIGGIAVWITYLAVEKLGLVKGPLILYTYPVYGSIFGIFILKEKLHGKNLAAIGLAIAGVYLLIVKKDGLDSLMTVGKYEIIAVIGAVMAGLTVAIIRKLHQSESTFEIFFAQCLFGTLLMLVPATMAEHSIDYRIMLLLLGIAATAIVGQLLMTEGFRYLPVKTASVLSMSELILNCSIGVLVFSEDFTVRSAAGAGLIIGACILSLAGKVNSKRV